MTGDDRPPAESHPAAGEPGWLFGPGTTPRARRMLLLVLVPALILAGTLRFDFVFDDNLVVLGDRLVAGQFNLREIFGSEVRVMDVTLGYYRPLVTLLYRADRALWGTNPAGYHLTNLLWHLLATVLVFRVAFLTTGRLAAAWTSAMLFALLPAHSETIGWIQGRTDLVSTAFLLLALLALLHARAAHAHTGWRWGAVGALAFLAALLAKESVAPLPLAWVMWEISAAGAGRWRARLAAMAPRVVPLLLAGVVYWLFRRWAVGDLVGFPMSLSPLPLRALALFFVLAEYGRVLLFPDLGLNLFRALSVAPTPMTLAISLAVAGILVGGLVVTWRSARPLFPWAAWVPIMLSVPLLFILYAPAPETGFTTAERFLYLPSVGWCVLLGSLLARAVEGRERAGVSSWGLATIGGVFVGYAGLTLLRLLPWADAADLYVAMKAQADLPVTVQVLVHNNLGKVYLDQGEFVQAREEFQAALRLKPDYAFAHNNLGVLLIRQGQPVEARRWLETAIRLDPTYADALGNLGAAYEATGDLAAARAAYEAGVRVAPGSAWLAGGLARVQAEAVSQGARQTGRSP
ncbi:MAG: tetratricopeptide repeat protein [candidate division NC10 bacterium]|nr:tetratricopeptide repeat protein [candidate division NC10 bacterium]